MGFALKKKKEKKTMWEPGVIIQICNPSTAQAEAGGFQVQA
jgi:hypothetical protein